MNANPSLPQAPPNDAGDPLMQMLAQVERIDALLQAHLRSMQQRPDDRLDMQVMLQEVDQLQAQCQQPRGRPAWLDAASAACEHLPDSPLTRLAPPPHTRLAQLCARFGLDAVERDLLLLALLPWFDSRYGTMLSYLQGDAARQWPSVELAARLLGHTPLARLRLQARWSPASPLLRHALLHSIAAKKGAPDHWSTLGLRADPAVFRYLVGQDQLAPELAACGRWLEMPHTPHTADIADMADMADTPGTPAHWRRQLLQAVAGSQASPAGACTSPRCIVFVRGSVGDGRATAVASAAAVAGVPVFCLRMADLPADDDEACGVLHQALREARLHGGWLLLRGLGGLADARRPVLNRAAGLLAADDGPLLCLCEPGEAMPWLGVRPQQLIEMAPRSMHEAEAGLRAGLVGWPTEDALDLAVLVRRFHVSPGAMPTLLAEGDLYRRRRGPQARLAQQDLHHAMRLRAQQNFGKLAQRLEPRRGFDDLIISDNLRRQLDEILAAIRQRERLLEQGFGAKLAYGLGISALFHGDSGTGKTMVAEVLAHELGVDLIKIDLSTVVNKYIGETEKNLSRIFDLAASDSGVLFFDEADALFGKRSETQDAQDRHANIEVSYLLQRLESYPGLVVLSTNNRNHLDSAFSRRITFITRFGFPDAALRERMWRQIWPPGIVLAPDIDFAALASRAEITGANIRNAALLAGWLASDAGTAVTQALIELALKRELAKIGRIAS